MTISMTEAARDLVDRAREGDQNAMAIIALVGKKARREKGAIKARIAFACIKKALINGDIGVEAPPVSKGALSAIINPESFMQAFSETFRCKDGLCAIVVALANGPPFTLSRLAEFSQVTQVGEESDETETARAQQALKFAHGIQIVRNGGPIATISKEAAWELGG